MSKTHKQRGARIYHVSLQGRKCQEYTESLGKGGKRTQRAAVTTISCSRRQADRIVFDRNELTQILNCYGRKVRTGEWRDYAIDFLKDRAVFSVFRRSSEFPLYRIIKVPQNARRQGAYSIVSAGGLIIRRGHKLARVLKVLEKRADLRRV